MLAGAVPIGLCLAKVRLCPTQCPPKRHATPIACVSFLLVTALRQLLIGAWSRRATIQGVRKRVVPEVISNPTAPCSHIVEVLFCQHCAVLITIMAGDRFIEPIRVLRYVGNVTVALKASTFTLSNEGDDATQAEIMLDYQQCAGGLPVFKISSASGNSTLDLTVVYSEGIEGIDHASGKETGR